MRNWKKIKAMASLALAAVIALSWLELPLIMKVISEWNR